MVPMFLSKKLLNVVNVVQEIFQKKYSNHILDHNKSIKLVNKMALNSEVLRKPYSNNSLINFLGLLKDRIGSKRPDHMLLINPTSLKKWIL